MNAVFFKDKRVESLLELIEVQHFHHASAEFANQIADSQVDKSTYHTQHKLFTCNHANDKENAIILMRSIMIAAIVGKQF